MNGVSVRMELCLTLANNALVIFADALYTSYGRFQAQIMDLTHHISHPARLLEAFDRCMKRMVIFAVTDPSISTMINDQEM